MLKQIDFDKDKPEIVPNVSIHDYGCLTISIFNILKRHEICTKEFTDFLNLIKTVGGYTKEGLLKWDIIKLLFGVEHRKIKKTDDFKFEDNIEYIVQVPYKETGHFCEVKGIKESNTIVYIDTYDGKTKEINRNDCISIRELTFM